MNLTPLDLLILCVPTAVILLVAVVLRRYLHSVADFLAASRCAGRYLICVAAAEIGAGIAGMVGGWEVFTKTGYSLNFWFSMTGFVYFMLTLTGIITFRFRETRCLTFHQFFELRYDKGLRVFASFLNFVSGLFTFGVVPGVSARFFVYFFNFPTQLSLPLLGAVPTYAIIMGLLLLLSLLFSVSGGQISVMVVDCLEGVFSNVFYLVVAFVLLSTVSFAQMRWAFTHDVVPGRSLVNPFDISGQPDFNGWFVVLALFGTLYYWRGGAWNAGFTAAGKTAHESKMAGVLGVWRAAAAGAMGFMVGAGAVTLLKHPAFAAKAALVQQHLATLPNDQLQRQMSIPTALGLLQPGIAALGGRAAHDRSPQFMPQQLHDALDHVRILRPLAAQFIIEQLQVMQHQFLPRHLQQPVQRHLPLANRLLGPPAFHLQPGMIPSLLRLAILVDRLPIPDNQLARRLPTPSFRTDDIRRIMKQHQQIGVGGAPPPVPDDPRGHQFMDAHRRHMEAPGGPPAIGGEVEARTGSHTEILSI